MEERILRQGRANLIVGKWFVDSGLGVLTNKRFGYFRARLSKILAMSARGGSVNLAQEEYAFDILLSEIASLSRGRHGLSKSILVITTKNGQQYKFAVIKYREWEISFRNALESVA